MQKVALITGGARRIGRAITQTLHAAGFRVIIHYHRSHADAAELLDTLNAQRADSAAAVAAPLSIVENADALNDFYQQVMATFGRLDLIVHNASSFYATPFEADFATLSAHWDDLFLTNAKAPLLLSHTFAADLKATHGSIVSILDIHAHDKPFVGYPIYNMAKAAHRMLVQSLALELAPEVRINGVAPGVNIFPDDDTNSELNSDTKATLTNSVPLGKIGEPADIAAAVLFLATADYITGQILAVDGGRSLTLKGG